MSIRYKIFIALIIATMMAMALGLMVVIIYLKPSIEAFERDQLLKDVIRLNSLIERDTVRFQSIATDWGFWDDTYQFVLDRNQEYIDTNLQEYWLDEYAVDGLAIVSDLSQDLISITQANGVVSKEVLSTITQSRNDVQGGGLIVVNQTLYLVGYSQIKGSDGSRESVGQIYFVKYLDQDWLELLSSQFKAEVSFNLKDSYSDPTVEFLSKNLARVSAPISPLKGSQAYPFFVIDEYREIRERLDNKIWLTIFIMLGVFACFALVLYAGLDKMLMRPLQNIRNQLLAVTGAEAIKLAANSPNVEFKDEIKTLEFLAGGAAKIVSRQQRKLKEERDTFEKDSLVDQLTGLYNRRGLDQLFRKRYGLSINPLCCVIFDLDHFKQVNDNFGHDGGDRALKEFAKILKSSFSEDSIISRSGGEEFVVILDQINSQEILNMLDSFRSRVRHELGENSGIDRKLTVSCGLFISCVEHGFDLSELMLLADSALYEAKIRRDCYVLYEQREQIDIWDSEKSAFDTLKSAPHHRIESD